MLEYMDSEEPYSDSDYIVIIQVIVMKVVLQMIVNQTMMPFILITKIIRHFNNDNMEEAEQELQEIIEELKSCI